MTIWTKFDPEASSTHPARSVLVLVKRSDYSQPELLTFEGFVDASGSMLPESVEGGGYEAVWYTSDNDYHDGIAPDAEIWWIEVPGLPM